jgi:hypothetical protein
MAENTVTATQAPGNPVETQEEPVVSLREPGFDFYRSEWQGVLMPDGFRSILSSAEEHLDTACALHELIELDIEHTRDATLNEVTYYGLQDRHRTAIATATKLLMLQAKSALEDIRTRGKQERP